MFPLSSCSQFSGTKTGNPGNRWNVNRSPVISVFSRFSVPIVPLCSGVPSVPYGKEGTGTTQKQG